MKIKNTILTALIFLLFVGCMEKAELTPLQLLEGTWVSVQEEDSGFVPQTYVFSSDGTFVEYFTKMEGNENLGILGSFSGKYSITDGKLQLRERWFFYPEDFDNPPSTLEDLVPMEVPMFQDHSAEISFKGKNQMMELIHDCFHFGVGPVFECLRPGPIRYTRME